jgi:hypothetical protein
MVHFFLWTSLNPNFLRANAETLELKRKAQNGLHQLSTYHRAISFSAVILAGCLPVSVFDDLILVGIVGPRREGTRRALFRVQPVPSRSLNPEILHDPENEGF